MASKDYYKKLGETVLSDLNNTISPEAFIYGDPEDPNRQQFIEEWAKIPPEEQKKFYDQIRYVGLDDLTASNSLNDLHAFREEYAKRGDLPEFWMEERYKNINQGINEMPSPEQMIKDRQDRIRAQEPLSNWQDEDAQYGIDRANNVDKIRNNIINGQNSTFAPSVRNKLRSSLITSMRGMKN
jgi:hypothetical protein